MRQHGGGAYFCGFTNDLATLTFDGEASTISGTDKDGNELFSHPYHYIGMEPVRGLYEFESDDADSGEFTYFFLCIELFCTENLAGQYAECDVEQKRRGTFLHKNYLKEVFS